MHEPRIVEFFFFFICLEFCLFFVKNKHFIYLCVFICCLGLFIYDQNPINRSSNQNKGETKPSAIYIRIYLYSKEN